MSRSSEESLKNEAAKATWEHSPSETVWVDSITQPEDISYWVAPARLYTAFNQKLSPCHTYLAVMHMSCYLGVMMGILGFIYSYSSITMLGCCLLQFLLIIIIPPLEVVFILYPHPQKSRRQLMIIKNNNKPLSFHPWGHSWE